MEGGQYNLSNYKDKGIQGPQNMNTSLKYHITIPKKGNNFKRMLFLEEKGKEKHQINQHQSLKDQLTNNQQKNMDAKGNSRFYYHIENVKNKTNHNGKTHRYENNDDINDQDQKIEDKSIKFIISPSIQPKNNLKFLRGIKQKHLKNSHSVGEGIQFFHPQYTQNFNQNPQRSMIQNQSYVDRHNYQKLISKLYKKNNQITQNPQRAVLKRTILYKKTMIYAPMISCLIEVSLVQKRLLFMGYIMGLENYTAKLYLDETRSKDILIAFNGNYQLMGSKVTIDSKKQIRIQEIIQISTAYKNSKWIPTLQKKTPQKSNTVRLQDFIKRNYPSPKKQQNVDSFDTNNKQQKNIDNKVNKKQKVSHLRRHKFSILNNIGDQNQNVTKYLKQNSNNKKQIQKFQDIYIQEKNQKNKKEDQPNEYNEQEQGQQFKEEFGINVEQQIKDQNENQEYQQKFEATSPQIKGSSKYS